LRKTVTEYDVTPPPERLADHVQLRTAFTTDRGTVTKFMIQLEYWLNSDWQEVVRYDHDVDAAGGHDVSAEGLHRDIYRDGEKYDTQSVTPPIPPNTAFERAEEDLRDNVERYIKRFETWHNVKDSSNL
jgi:hypothetical protein